MFTPSFLVVAACAQVAGLGWAGPSLTGLADSGGCAGWAYCWAGMDHMAAMLFLGRCSLRSAGSAGWFGLWLNGSADSACWL